VKPFARVFANMFDHGTLDTEASRSRQIHQEWDRQRANALTPAERSEIDAIFGRNL
jgi:hypothetical protein